MTRQEIERVKKLVETPVAQLRVAAFDESADQPSQREADIRFQGWTRAELIEHILVHLEGYSLDDEGGVA